MDVLRELLGGQTGLPHGWCLLWSTPLVWLHVAADALITLAYYAIPVALVYFVRKRRDVAFHWTFLLFAAFIFAGGTTHLMGIWTIWQPVHGLEAMIKLLTAAVSMATAAMLIPFMPRAVALPSPAQLAAVNRVLQAEVAERKRAEEALRELTDTLERRVEGRTAELTGANHALQAEMAERQRAEGQLVRLNRELQRRITEFQTLLDVLPIGIAVAEDPHCRYIWANAWLSNLLGVAPGENISPTSRPTDDAPYQLCHGGQELPLAEHPMQYAAAHGEEVRDVEMDVVYRDGRTVRLLGYASPLFDETGQVRGCLGTYVGITERREPEAQLRSALQEKELLLKEIHHRVKNNLQIISSLLDLQAETVADPQVRAVFDESQHRIQAMALLHESLYQSNDLAHLDAADYLRRLSQRLFSTYRGPEERITLKLELETVTLGLNRAIPCGLLLNELLSNCLKHAFPGGQEGEVYISLRQEPVETCVLVVRDNGVGLPDGVDFRTAESLGLQLVGMLTEQLGGTIALERHGGTTFTVTFPM